MGQLSCIGPGLHTRLEPVLQDQLSCCLHRQQTPLGGTEREQLSLKNTLYIYITTLQAARSQVAREESSRRFSVCVLLLMRAASGKLQCWL